MTESSNDGDGLHRLACALASNNQHKENDDLMQWLETASVDDLRLTFPVLLNWSRNSAKRGEKSKTDKDKGSTSKSHSLKATMERSGDNKASDHSDPIILTPTTSAEDVSQKIVKVLEEAIEFDAEDTKALTADETEVDRMELQKKNNSISSLRMALAGYLHTNHGKMRKFPTVANLERRTKAKVSFDRAATNTLNMVNAASPSPLSVSQYLTPEEDAASSRSWGIPHINIDLGLGLQQTSPADVCKEFIRDQKDLLHPFTGEKVGRMEVKKVIPSKRKPVWIEYYSPDNRPLKPDVLAKQGDDLRNDASVKSFSKLCETIWAKAPIQWTLGVPPTVCAYDVLVTATDAGYLEMVPGKNFLDLSDVKNGWDGVDIRKLAPSLVGSYIVNFILGVRDRHEDNMMVVGDLQKDPRMMQIDFGYVLMEFPGGVHFDMPRLTMPIPLVDRYNSEKGRGSETTLMEDLQHDMLAAYLVLRRHSNQLIPFCSHLMSSSYEYKHVESILKGRHVFRTDQSENKVIQWMSQKLTNQWAHFYFRREIKLGMVRGYYKFVEMTNFESNKSSSKDDESDSHKERNSNSSTLTGRIKSFFTHKSNSSSAKENTNEEGNDNQSYDSVPAVLASTNNTDGEQDQSVVIDMSAVDINDNNTDEVAASHNNDGKHEIDMSLLNERVTEAMKFQKEVSQQMISQKQKHGTLDLM